MMNNWENLIQGHYRNQRQAMSNPAGHRLTLESGKLVVEYLSLNHGISIRVKKILTTGYVIG